MSTPRRRRSAGPAVQGQIISTVPTPTVVDGKAGWSRLILPREDWKDTDTQFFLEDARKLFGLAEKTLNTLRNCDAGTGGDYAEMLWVELAREAIAAMQLAVRGLFREDEGRQYLTVAHISFEAIAALASIREASAKLQAWADKQPFGRMRHRPPAAALAALASAIDQVRIATPPATEPAERLRFDPETVTVLLDGRPFEKLDPTAFRALEALWRLFREKRRPISSRELRKEAGLAGKNLRREFAKLPTRLRRIVCSRDGAGRWVKLPPAPSCL
jgi:hypothetical protein